MNQRKNLVLETYVWKHFQIFEENQDDEVRLFIKHGSLAFEWQHLQTLCPVMEINSLKCAYGSPATHKNKI
jgi:hypothetical protein